MTLPIVGRAWFDHYGWVYNPRYASVFCDNEMQEVAKMLDKHHYVETVIIEHRHPLWVQEPYDALMQHTESFYQRDGAIFKKRKERKFNLVPAPGRTNSHGEQLYLRTPEPRRAGPMPR
jgi:hypothetical protein